MLITKYFTKKNTLVLDAGCGAGREARWLAENGYRVIGVDFSSPMLKKANEIKNNKIKFIKGNLKNLSFSDKAFDYAVLIHGVLPIIPKKEERIKILKEIYRVLKPEGILIFSTVLDVSWIIKIVFKISVLPIKIFH